MTATALAPIRRILLALDASNETVALEAAAALAARLDADLEALFVEDEELLRLAALPFSGEVGFASATRRPLRDQDIERTLRSRAARSQATLAAAAIRTHIRWSFRVIRGQVASCVSAASVQADIVTLSVSGDPMQQLRSQTLVRHMLATAARPLLVLPPGTDLRPPYLVVFDGSRAAQRSILLALQLGATSAPGPIRVLLTGEGIARRHEVEALLSEGGVRADIRVAPGPLREAVLDALRSGTPGTLLLPASDGLQAPEQIERLLGSMGCALLLVPG